MSLALANPRRLANLALAAVARPSPPIDYERWAEKNIVFTDRESSFPGPFNSRLFPFFSEIYKALAPDDPCRVVTLSKSAQLGGTIMANVFVLGSQDLDPCDFLYVHPTEENARRWSKTKLKIMLDAAPRLRDIFPEKSRDGGDSVLFKERADGRGSILVSGANSPASLSQVSMRRQVQDDLSKWNDNAAGDPEDQANSRSRAFEFAKIFKIGTPLIEPGCRITRNFAAGSQEYCYVPCPHCGFMQTLEIENFLSNLDDEHPEKACFSCVECGSLIEEHHRDAIVESHEWRSRNPGAKREHRSFNVWSAYSRLQSFERIAREWLAVRGEPSKERVFYNDTAGRAYKIKGEAPAWEDLRNRADATGYSRGTIPAPVLILTCGLDVQDGWFKYQVVGWSRDGRSFVIDWGQIDGHIIENSVWPKLDALLSSTWRHESGRRLGLDLLAIDGNAWTEEVWSWAKRHPVSKVVMVRGVDGDDRPLLARVKKERNSKTGKLLKYSSRFYNFAASILKWSLYKRLPKTDILERGYVGFPVGLGDDYFKELTAERRVEKKNKSGFSKFVWEIENGQRNEALDTYVQANAAAIKYGLRDLPPATWDRLEDERASPMQEAQMDLETALATLPEAPQQTPPSPAPRRRRLWEIGKTE